VGLVNGEGRKIWLGQSYDSSSPCSQMKVSEMYMHSALRIHPTRPREGTLPVFTHINLRQALDNNILVEFFLSWDVLYLPLKSAK
jgi:hypothetical protein